MTHIAIQENLGGKVVDWMEKVRDEQYQIEQMAERGVHAASRAKTSASWAFYAPRRLSR